MLSQSLLLLACDSGGSPPPTDGSPQDHALTDLAAKPDATVDGGHGNDGVLGDGATGGTFACGAVATCKASQQYCETMSPGACGGSPVPDSGVCAPNCSPNSCGGSQNVCLCRSFRCTTLPSGCKDCACLNKATGCSCKKDPVTGGLTVSCAAP